MQTEVRVYEGRLDKALEKTYVPVPFEVPWGAIRADVSCAYDDPISAKPGVTGGNTLDLGVFDSRGIEFLGSGFRGWSGSERQTFFIAEAEATPGYLPGKLPAGQWHVVLGLYKIAPAGCKYRITVSTISAPDHGAAVERPPPRRELPASLPPARFTPWLRGEMHCHTWHSDGDSSPADVVHLARDRGLDFLAITDHNTTSTLRELETFTDPGLILVKGVECTTYAGHFNVWGNGDFVDFRVTTPDAMIATIREAEARGGLTSCNHPFPAGPNWDYPQVTSYRCMEVWNGPWHPGNQTALERWVGRLATGAHVPAVGGSDFHSRRELTQEPPRAPGTPTVWAYVPGAPGADGILRAVSQGHVTLSDGPDGPFLDVRAGPEGRAMGGDSLSVPNHGRLPVRIGWNRGTGTVLRVLDQRDTLLEQRVGSSDGAFETELRVADSLYLRVELRDDSGAMRAMTNPVYLERCADDRA